MKPATRRRIGAVAGAVIGLAFAAGSATRGWHQPGPMNVGHADVPCGGCHRDAPGTLRQQLQMSVRALVGASTAPGDVGYRAVENAGCTECHDQQDDRHPSYRFAEPRFADARARLHPERCISCHAEHRGVRVTRDAIFCRECHAAVALERDPLDVPHQALALMSAWDSCLGCHDYHGNHAVSQIPRRVSEATPPDAVMRYFHGGPSPYGPPVREALTEVSR